MMCGTVNAGVAACIVIGGERSQAWSRIVTGGSRGIGLATARALLETGARVAITATSDETLRAGRRGARDSGRRAMRCCRFAPTSAQQTQVEQAIETVVRRFGGLDVLVNNAGVGIFRPSTDMTADEWHRVIDTNLTGVFYCCRAALPHLRARGGGWIINISSLSSTGPFADGAAYCASKAGLNAFSEALMQEVRHDGIRVAYVLPGSVRTDFSGRSPAADDEWKLAPEDVAQAVADLIAYPVAQPAQPRRDPAVAAAQEGITDDVRIRQAPRRARGSRDDDGSGERPPRGGARPADRRAGDGRPARRVLPEHAATRASRRSTSRSSSNRSATRRSWCRASSSGRAPDERRRSGAGRRRCALQPARTARARGPGELFRARDTRLGRTVAVRLLPADFTPDAAGRDIADRAARRSLIALSHPNVTTRVRRRRTRRPHLPRLRVPEGTAAARRDGAGGR